LLLFLERWRFSAADAFRVLREIRKEIANLPEHFIFTAELSSIRFRLNYQVVDLFKAE
jgi:hypothetical protein